MVLCEKASDFFPIFLFFHLHELKAKAEIIYHFIVDGFFQTDECYLFLLIFIIVDCRGGCRKRKAMNSKNWLWKNFLLCRSNENLCLFFFLSLESVPSSSSWFFGWLFHHHHVKRKRDRERNECWGREIDIDIVIIQDMFSFYSRLVDAKRICTFVTARSRTLINT